MTTPGSPPVTLDNCATEPIHLPGSIQPHGALFACRGDKLLITQISANAAEYVGAADALLGTPVLALFDPASAAAIATAMRSPETAREVSPIAVVTRQGRTCDAVVHRSVTGPVILELEASAGDAAEHPAFDHRLRAAVVRLQSARDIDSLSRLAAEQVRELAGFDRVMVYRFDADWNGEVVAENKREDLEPFLGLHYPASDIPAQARRLYTINLLRFIGDVAYRPSPLVPSFDPETNQSLDLSFAQLRSVSPIHIEYLTNMGVTASMSVSLVIDGVLAGLIACHHYSGPWIVGTRVRDTIEFLAQAFAWQLRVLEAAAAGERDAKIKMHESALVSNVATTPKLQVGLLVEDLLKLVDAEGAAVVLEEGTYPIGVTPPAETLKAIARDLKALSRDVVAVDGMSDDLPSLTAEHPGLLAVTISQTLGEYILWFRPSTEMTVDWAGDPRKVTVSQPAGAPPRLSPRGSFQLWRETVQGKALPWQPWHIAAASNLRRVLLGGIRQRAAELHTINERLLDADRAKDDFLAVVSHELRSPLNAIMGYHQLLNGGKVPAPQLEKGLEVIGRNAKTLADLVDDLLDVSRMVSGKLALSLDGVDLPALVESVLDGFVVAAEAKQLRIKRVLDSSATPVLGDATRLRQVIANLLSNAIKFTPKGSSIIVTLVRVESDVELAVTDTGQGIRAELLPLVFDMFRQGDMGMNRRSRGLGIGLALARRITELHGGSIRVQSAGEGKGATFSVRLPLSSVKPERAVIGNQAAGSMLANVRCLVVDDEPDARELVCTVLQRDGALVTSCASAEEALVALRDAKFDVLVSDIGMPEMDGLQLLREIRQRSPEEGSRTPAVALTAYSRSLDRTSALQAGFNAHVPKPVDAEELVAVVGSLSGRLGFKRS